MARFRVLIWCLALLLLAPGCKDTDNAIDALNDGIRQLELTSVRWEKVLEETRDKLIAEGRSALANEVSTMIERTIQSVGVGARCYTDFLRDRVHEELMQMRARLTGESRALVPVFCKPAPDAINLNVPAELRPLIVIDGYNLSKEVIHATLEHEGSPPVGVNDMIDVFGTYQATVNVNRLPLSASSTRLVFALGADPAHTTKSSIPVLPAKPEPPAYLYTTIHVYGYVYLHDHETFGSDEVRDVPINEYVSVPTSIVEFHWGGNGAGCVGGEVNGYLDLFLVMDPTSAGVSINGSTRYYEGTTCGATELQKSGSFPADVTIKPGASYYFYDSLADGQGSVTYSLTFTNEAPQTTASIGRARARSK